MKKFRFRLEPILRLKEHLEQEKQKAHAEALHRINDQEQRLVSIRADRGKKQSQLRQNLEGSLNISLLSSYNRYFVMLNRNELTGRELLRTFEKNADEKHRELVEATKQRRIYEKLKERHREKHRKAGELLERKEQDEISSQIHQYKKNSRRSGS